MEKLKLVLGQNVFVVSLVNDVLRKSVYGQLDDINESCNIVLSKPYLGVTVIPIDNGFDKILKIYDKQGYVVYDAENKPRKSFRKR